MMHHVWFRLITVFICILYMETAVGQRPQQNNPCQELDGIIQQALQRVTNRRKGSCSKNTIESGTSPVKLLATVNARREDKPLADNVGFIGDVVETATQLFLVRNAGRVPDPELFRKCIRPYCDLPKVVCNPHDRYRNPFGYCNNLDNPTWGASFTALRRYLTPTYGDGFNIGTVPRIQSVKGPLLPSPRIISNAVNNAMTSSLKDPKYNVGLLQFGEFIALDINKLASLEDCNGPIYCCSGNNMIIRPECFAFTTPVGDFKTTCHHFVRSEMAPQVDCSPGPRNQMNQKTAFLDLSTLYGYTQEGRNRIRQFGTDDPKSLDFIVTYLHVIFLKEQEKIMNTLKMFGWPYDMAFEETKKILTGMFQRIVYREYLPAIIGKRGMRIHGLCGKSRYNKKVDPSIRNAFVSAAFRFSHSSIRSLDTEFVIVFTPNDFKAYINNITNPSIFNTLLSRREGKVDRFFENGPRNKFFETMPDNGFDLNSISIQRGRDHGIPSYNEWRKYCGLTPVKFLKPGVMGFRDHEKQAGLAMSSVYRHPDDVDLFVAGLSERPAPGALVGPTFRCIIAQQFKALRDGDRFFYENEFYPTGFTKGQLREIKKQSLSALICRNINLASIPRNPFISTQTGVQRFPCNSFPRLNLKDHMSDVLGDQTSFKFSTIDQDNDNYSGHCAQIRQAGWWFRGCSASCFNGRIQQGVRSWTTMHWHPWHNGPWSLKESIMLIK